MTRSKGEITRRAESQMPHYVALPAEKVRDRVNREVILCAAGVLSATPLTYFVRRDDLDYIVLCFAKPQDAEAFAERFGGERLATGGQRDPINDRAARPRRSGRTQGAEGQLM